MSLAPDPSAAGSPFDALAPLRLPEDLRLTPEQFERVCATNPEAVLELSADASVVHLQRWQALTPEQRRGFAPLCPDLVVELAEIWAG